MPLPLTVWQMMRSACRLASGSLPQSLDNAIHVVAIDLEHGEAEAAPFVAKRLQVLDFAGACRLDLVVVDHGGEVGQLVLAGAHRRLPDGALIDLAVAHDDEDAAVALLRARRERHADADRKPVAERAGRGLDSRDLAALGMAAQDASRRGRTCPDGSASKKPLSARIA